MLPKTPIRAWGIAFLALAPGPAFAQDAGPPPASRTIAIVVHDKHGKPLATVDKADLELQVDSKPVVISRLETAAQKPLFLGLILDTGKRQEQVVPEAKAPEKTFLGAYAGKSGDQEFVIHFDRQIELMQDLTGDAKLLNSAIDELQPANSEESDDTSSRDDDDERARRPAANGERIYDAVLLAADEILRKPEGRKVVVVVSDGVDHGSKESFASAVEAAQRSGVAVYTVYVPGEKDPADTKQGTGSQGGQQRRTGGIGWPGSPGGSGPGGGQSPRQSRREPLVQQDGRKILLEMAQKTGGAMFEARKKEDLDGVLKDITQYLQDEVSLTFNLDPEMTGSFHRIALTSHGPDKVQAPQAFYTGR